MEEVLSILLVEDDPFETDAIKKYAHTVSDVRLLANTDSSYEGILLVKTHLPDVVILDLELHHGSGNGLIFLEELTTLDVPFKPYILITTNNTSPITHNRARQYNVDFIMAKFQKDYSAQTVIEFLRSQKEIIHKNNARLLGLSGTAATIESPNELMKRISTRINRELELIGISPKVKGKPYLHDGIALVMQDPDTRVSRILAQKYKKTDDSIERAMSTAINGAWRKTEIDNLEKYYTAYINPDRGVPTVSEFIFYYAEKIKREL
jgi:DNA-binding NarL/FixJ family response regulator